MILLRIFLVGLIIYLLFRSFFRYFNYEEETRKTGAHEKSKSADVKKVSKEIGEYVDYEEVDKK